MIEKDIVSMLKSRKRYESEIMILRDCADELNDSEVSVYTNRYAILKRRLSLIDHWMHFLPEDEKMVVDKHLVQGWAWPKIVAFLQDVNDGERPNDARRPQRAQERAIKRLAVFMDGRFDNSLDYLIDTDNFDIPEDTCS